MSDQNTATGTVIVEQTKTATRAQPRTEQLPPWNVVLINDEDHTYEYVIRMMQNLFGHSTAKAFKIALTVDTDGRAVCLTTHREHAELKRDQVIAFGRDPLMASSVGPMTVVLEPAEFGGSDEGGDSAK